jgi:hypothetical protein
LSTWQLASASGVSGDGTAIVGSGTDPSGKTQAWLVNLPISPPVPVLQVSPTTDISASGPTGGPFSPSSFDYAISASKGSVNYSISGVPSWLTPSSITGTATTTPTTVTFTLNASANSLAIGTYNASITFNNGDTNVGTQTRTATLNIGSGAGTNILAAVAPNARTTAVGAAVTGFATILNVGGNIAVTCSIALPAGTQASFVYQTTDPATNKPTGTSNTPVNIGVGQGQTFYFAITPNAVMAEDIPLVFTCNNAGTAPVVPGLNTFLLTASATPVADMLSLADTLTNDGNMVLPA